MLVCVIIIAVAAPRGAVRRYQVQMILRPNRRQHGDLTQGHAERRTAREGNQQRLRLTARVEPPAQRGHQRAQRHITTAIADKRRLRQFISIPLCHAFTSPIAH